MTGRVSSHLRRVCMSMSKSFQLSGDGDGDTLLTLALVCAFALASMVNVSIVVVGFRFYPMAQVVFFVTRSLYKWHFRRRLRQAGGRGREDGA